MVEGARSCSSRRTHAWIEPRGLLLDAGTGVTGPAGTGTTLGTQGTANMGTDAL
jgi:hypothetical protein